jgi:hypothetical protein
MGMGRNSISAERRHARSIRGKVWIVGGRSKRHGELWVGALHERGMGAQLGVPADLTGCARRSGRGRARAFPSNNGRGGPEVLMEWGAIATHHC